MHGIHTTDVLNENGKGVATVKLWFTGRPASAPVALWDISGQCNKCSFIHPTNAKRYPLRCWGYSSKQDWSKNPCPLCQINKEIKITGQVMISTTMKQSGRGKPSVPSIEEGATQPLGASPPSLSLFVCLLIVCPLLQDPVCLDQLHLGSEIFISQRTSRNSAVSTLPDLCVRWFSSFLLFFWWPFPCSYFQYFSLCFRPKGFPPWSLYMSQRSWLCLPFPARPPPWTWRPPNSRRRVSLRSASSRPQWSNSSRGLCLVLTQSLLWHLCPLSNWKRLFPTILKQRNSHFLCIHVPVVL